MSKTSKSSKSSSDSSFIKPGLSLTGSGLFDSWENVPWDSDRWPNFKPDEKNIACPCCGEFYFDTEAFDFLQAARIIVGQPFKINSGHRCSLHNEKVGGTVLSQHRKIAFDISILNHKYPSSIFNACRDSGFTGFGYYTTFIHVDTGRAREWNLEYKHIFKGE